MVEMARSFLVEHLVASRHNLAFLVVSMVKSMGKEPYEKPL